MQLSTPRLILREFRESDLETILTIPGDKDAFRFERSLDRPAPSLIEAWAILQQILTAQTETPRTYYHLAITCCPDDTPVGWIKLTLNNREIRQYEIGWAVQRADWNKGYATEAARELMKFAFNNLHAHRIIAFCHAENIASWRVMEKLGMEREGWFKEGLWLNGEWKDEFSYAIIDRAFHDTP